MNLILFIMTFTVVFSTTVNAACIEMLTERLQSIQREIDDQAPKKSHKENVGIAVASISAAGVGAGVLNTVQGTFVVGPGAGPGIPYITAGFAATTVYQAMRATYEMWIDSQYGKMYDDKLALSSSVALIKEATLGGGPIVGSYLDVVIEQTGDYSVSIENISERIVMLDDRMTYCSDDRLVTPKTIIDAVISEIK